MRLRETFVSTLNGPDPDHARRREAVKKAEEDPFFTRFIS